jgi:hypothetical protein
MNNFPKNNISVIEPINKSFNIVKKLLFSPFDLSRWFIIGFCCWLANLGGGRINFRGPSGIFDNKEDSSLPFEDIKLWVTEYLFLIIIFGVILFLLLVTISLVISWLSSRGKFMFLDCVVKNQAEVKKPWREFKCLGNRLFIFKVIFGFIVFLVFIIIGAALFLIYRINLIAVIVSGVIFFILFILILGLISLFLEDFVIPIMYKRNIFPLAAFSEFIELFKKNIGRFVLYVLFKIVISIAIGMIACVSVCLTCCIAVIPYIGTVILLPLFVFQRAYSIAYLEQYGENYRFFGSKEETPL